MQATATPTQLARTLTLALHIVKELSTVRIQRSRAALSTAAPELFAVLQDAYFGRTQAWEQRLAQDRAPDDNVIRSMDTSEQLLKILRRLIVSSFREPTKNVDVAQFWDHSAAQTHRLVSLLQQARGGPYFMLTGLHLVQLAKFHVSMANEHPLAFATFTSTPDLVRMYWAAAKPMRDMHFSAASDDDEDYHTVYDSFCLRALLLLRASFRISYSTGSSLKFMAVKSNDDGKAAKEKLKSQLLTGDLVREIFEVLIQKFFIWGPTDLEEWAEEPEEWEFKEEGEEDAYERSVRPCAERLFLDIVLQYKDEVVQPLMQQCSNISRDWNPLQKEAILSAVGIAAAMLHGRFDFDGFLKDTIVPELQSQGEFANVVRRRIAITLAQWANVDISPESRTLIYQIFEHLLDTSVPANDLAVRVSAVKQLHEVTNVWNFRPDDFSKFATPILGRLISMISEVQLPESKMALLQTLSDIVENMDLRVGPFADQIVSLLPALWDESGSQHLMKQAIVNVFVRLVASLKGNSVPLHSLVIPIVHSTLEPGSEAQLYLLEECLELLREMLVQAPEPTMELQNLAPLVMPVLEMERSFIEKALEIVYLYLMLSPEYMLRDDMRIELLRRSEDLLTSSQGVNLDLTMKNLSIMVQSAEQLQGEQGVQAITHDLHAIGIIEKALNKLTGNWAARQAARPGQEEDYGLPADHRNVTGYLCLFSRVVLGHAPSFLEAVGSWCNSKGQDREETLKRLLEEWFGHMDSVGDPSKTKLMCMALTKLSAIGQSFMLAKLQDLMTMWTSMVVELRTDENDNSTEYVDGFTAQAHVRLTSLYSCMIRTGQLEADEASIKIQNAFAMRDPVFRVPVGDFIKHSVRQAIENCGGERIFQDEWLVNVDKHVVEAFRDLGIV